MTADTVTDKALPTEDEYVAASRDLGIALATLEDICTKLRKFEEAAVSEQDDAYEVPTYEDVGCLFSFLDGVEVDVRELKRLELETRAALSAVNDARMNAECEGRG